MQTTRGSRAWWMPGALVVACWLGISFAGPCVGSCAGLFAEAGQDASLDDLEDEFRSAVQVGNLYDARKIADRIADLGTADAVDVLVGYGLRADSYDLEKAIGYRLVKIQGESALQRIIHHANEHKDHRVRIVLTKVLGSRTETESLEAVLRNLYDRFVSVVLTAIEVIQDRDDVRAVDTLIEALAYQEEHAGGGNTLLVYEIRRTLTKLTGQDLELAADWRNFWEPRRKNFERPSEKERGESLTGVRTKRTDFFGMEVADDKVIFLLDISGSMEKKDPFPEEPGAGDGEGGLTGVRKKKKKDEKKEEEEEEVPDSRMRLRRVQAELVRVLSELPSDTQFNIISFNHQVGRFEEGLVKASSRNKDLAIRYVRNFAPMGETHTDEALRAAFDVQDATTIFLLSDGAPRRDNELLDIDPILDDVREMNRFRRVRIHTVGFEQAGSNLRKFMTRLAAQNKGDYTELR